MTLLVGAGSGIKELCLLIGVDRRGGGAILLAKLRGRLKGVRLDGRRRGASITYAAVVGVVVLGAWHLRRGPWRLVVGLGVGSGRGMQHSDRGVWLDYGREYLSHLSVEVIRRGTRIRGRQLVVDSAGTCVRKRGLREERTVGRQVQDRRLLRDLVAGAEVS